MQTAFIIFAYLLSTITYFLRPSLNSSRTTSYMVHFFSVGSASSDKQSKSVSLCSLGRFGLYFLTSMTIARDETNAEALVFKFISLWENISAFSFNFGSKRSIKALSKTKTKNKLLHRHQCENIVVSSEGKKCL